MLSYLEFATLAQATIPSFQHQWLNPEQEQAVSSPLHPPLYIVAGPGAGKTTALVLRTLKFIFVDQVPPPAIIATTFTRKAAAELRSRILSWGYAILDQAIAQETDPARIQWLHNIDINLINTGTLDSLAEIFLADCRQPGEIVPATIEGFLAKSLMRKVGLFPQRRYQNANLEALLRQLEPTHYLPFSMAEKSKNILAIADRVRHDAINTPAYAVQNAGHQVLGDVISDYLQYLQQNHLTDFGGLEYLLLEKLQHNNLGNIVGQLRAVLVDELQDTNYLQEQIYTEFGRQSGASLTVVGDDDQSIYRFRGATVEIFADFQNRITQALGPQWFPARVDLYRNYRSTSRIVNFCQHFVQMDLGYQPSRAQGKVPLQPHATFANDPTRNVPVLGMFRTDVATLADDLTQLLWDVFRGGGRQIACGNATFSIKASQGGDFGDSVLLAHSVRERKNDHDRLPLLIRQRLNALNIRAFNPRGQSLSDIPVVQRLLGLAMECIDPNAAVQNSILTIPQSDRDRMTAWRQVSLQFVATNPAPGGLVPFLQGWQTHTVGARSGMQRWPTEWPLLELIFTIITWLPEFQHDPEGQVYLEAIARTIAEAGRMSSYGARILWGAGFHDRNSIQEALHDYTSG
jgi:DNA helicase-2/ATP-dependent DNA helicase PcrA